MPTAMQYIDITMSLIEINEEYHCNLDPKGSKDIQAGNPEYT
jgi:hypothetical protein